MPNVLGIKARALDDLVTEHFTVNELTDPPDGWWSGDVEGEVARYEELARTTLEPARAILGVAMIGISGARPLGYNTKGRGSSMHLPPVQRADPAYRFLDRPPAKRAAALDFVCRRMAMDEVFWRLDAAQRDGRLPPGGLFWYEATDALPGPATGRFVHVDNRGFIAREADLTPPRSHA